MRNHYDFSNAKKNPYAKFFKKQITIRLDTKTIDYFKNISTDTDLSYQNLINLYLRDCVRNRKKLALKWQ